MDMDQAMLAWLRLFPVAEHVKSFEDLKDGVALAAVLSDLHPTYAIDRSSLSSGSDSWILNQQNLNKVLAGLMDVYRERLQVAPEKVPLTTMVNAAQIAKTASPEDLRLVLRLLVTSMVCSPQVASVGKLVMDMAQDADREGYPALIAQMMQETQDEYDFNVVDPDYEEEDEEGLGASGGDGDGDGDGYFADPAVQELRVYGRATENERALLQQGGFRSAAELEERIEELQARLCAAEDHVAEEVRRREEVEERLSDRDRELQEHLERQYQKADPAAEAEAERERKDLEAQVAALRQEIVAREESVAEMKLRLKTSEAQGRELERVQDDLEIMREKVPALEREAERSRKQRDSLQEQVVKSSQLQASLERSLGQAQDEAREFERKYDRERVRAEEAGDLRTKLVVADAATEALRGRVERAEEELEPVMALVREAKAKDVTQWVQDQARAMSRLQAERAELEQQLQEALETRPEQGGGHSLADELGAAQASTADADEKRALRSRISDLEEQLRDASERQSMESARGQQQQLHLQQEISALREKVAGGHQVEEGLREQVSKLEKDRDAAEEQATKARTELRELSVQHRTTEQELRSQAEQSADADAEKADLQAALQRAKEDAARLKELRATVETERDEQAKAHESEKDLLTQSLREAEARLAAKDKELAAKAASAADVAAAARVKELTADNEELRGHLEVYKGEAENLRRLVEQSHREQAPLPKGLPEPDSGTLKRERDEARAELDAIKKAQLSGGCAKCADADTRIKELSREMRMRQEKFQQQYEHGRQSSNRELRLVAYAYYDSNVALMHQQLGMLGDNSQPQSWLARKKFDAHEFSKTAWS